MDNLINIGIPSKGRLRVDVLKIFKKKKLKIISERGERDLIGSIFRLLLILRKLLLNLEILKKKEFGLQLNIQI